MEGLLVVVGATGLQGSSVIEEALKRNIKVRGLTRDTSSEAAKALQGKGVEMRNADLDDPKSLTVAFEGATAIFAVTDFWEPFVNYLMSGQVDAWERAKTEEIRRGKNVVDAANETMGSLQHFIFSSLPSVDNLSDHKMSKLNHYEGKAEIARYMEQIYPVARSAGEHTDKSAEAVAPNKQLSDVTTLLYCGYYMENFVRWELNAYLLPQKDESGALFVSTRATPSTPLELLDTRKDVGLFVLAILERQPQTIQGPPVLAVSERMDFDSIYKVISKVVGRDIVYRQSAEGDMERNDPALGSIFEQMYEFFNEYGFAGETKMIGRDELGILGRTTSFEEFVRRHSWEGFLS